MMHSFVPFRLIAANEGNGNSQVRLKSNPAVALSDDVVNMKATKKSNVVFYMYQFTM